MAPFFKTWRFVGKNLRVNGHTLVSGEHVKAALPKSGKVEAERVSDGVVFEVRRQDLEPPELAGDIINSLRRKRRG